jgi:hypothetical protein
MKPLIRPHGYVLEPDRRRWGKISPGRRLGTPRDPASWSWTRCSVLGPVRSSAWQCQHADRPTVRQTGRGAGGSRSTPSDASALRRSLSRVVKRSWWSDAFASVTMVPDRERGPH